MNDILELRRHLHRNPELSGKEYETAKTISAFLKKYQPDELLENLGNGTGIIAVYLPEKEVKQTILFRCELDALPIQEINNFEHKSLFNNVSHKCGHDGHMSLMCLFAKKIAMQKMKHTKLLLLFQPAEENGEGAVAIIADERFKKLNPDKVFALHNIPGAEMHEVLVKNNTFTCAVNSIIIKLHGKTSHAAEPQNGHNPAVAISEIIQEFQKKTQDNPDKEKFTVMTPIYINMGTKDHGISAGFGEIHYTFRRNANREMKELETELETIAREIAQKHHLKPEISWTQKFSANENAPEVVDFVRNAAKELNFKITEKKYPFTFGEDFGIFTEHYKGAMFGLGSGIDTPALHNPDYDWPDELTETGAELFYKISQQIDAQ
ncbi:amidohydrolase [Halpernia humi]|uniref:Amidohydrolase n=1 Tax=Halpernia humi TaxID=493375 RepID=A0A1H5U763_9FLAO|nr:amidohydrolase [Halpernia humi]SEF70819.1 amidohydrolase [Halpernia humi]